ncbi:hypothetical protein WOLCODRAFT_159063 [Wolfiporia cocos MD-104 SS10]|uniref:Uncharacterized protein n=1 Tax=Wolfiporia cocos (strain MD-104) TaxID=742152 RepID=A0A2H3JD42_WOLCO|nr:hypothetical protein WOLCODRAFT_159063 [Wolfiporia cocos MD-104 SS10]
MPRAARFTVKPKNAASGVREEWDIRPTQALEDRISDAVAPRAKKSRKGNAPKPYHRGTADPAEVARVNHEWALEDIRRKKIQKLLRQKEKLEKRLDEATLDDFIAKAAAKRVEEERASWSLQQRLSKCHRTLWHDLRYEASLSDDEAGRRARGDTAKGPKPNDENLKDEDPPAKSILERVEELRMPAEWVEARGLSNPKDVHCTEKKWDWFLEIQKKMVSTHPTLYRLARADDYSSPPAILTWFTLITTDFDDLCANLEHRVRQDTMQNKEMRLLEKYLKQMEHIFGDLEVDKHTTYLKKQLVHAKLDFNLVVSYKIIPRTMYETHKVTTAYRPEVGKHTWPGEQTCLMDYLRVVFGIRVRGSVTSFNSIPPHIRGFINFNHLAYIKYYSEDSTRNHISWYKWDKYAMPIRLAELICLYGDVHWYMEGATRAPRTPQRSRSRSPSAPEPEPLFGTLPSLLPAYPSVLLEPVQNPRLSRNELEARMHKDLEEVPPSYVTQVGINAYKEARYYTRIDVMSNLSSYKSQVDRTVEAVWNKTNQIRSHNQQQPANTTNDSRGEEP